MSTDPATSGWTPQLLERLHRMLPEPRCELRHHDAWSLLAATILSAQSTDRRVNQITPVLFDTWPTIAALASATPEDVEPVIKASGTYRQKAKRLVGAARALMTDHGGEVPRSLDALVTLPGVARKTANLVLGIAYGIASGIVVDTHVRRVSQRLGLTAEDKVQKIERDLMTRFDESDWIAVSHQLVLLGRYVCKARKPSCESCPINEICRSASVSGVDSWENRADAARAQIHAALDDSLGD